VSFARPCDVLAAKCSSRGTGPEVGEAVADGGGVDRDDVDRCTLVHAPAVAGGSSLVVSRFRGA
jgi:hypothetical protein